MASSTARMKVAQAWQTPATKGRLFDEDLAEAFAEILDEVKQQGWLGYVTTEELLNELRARCALDGTLHYRPVDGVS